MTTIIIIYAILALTCILYFRKNIFTDNLFLSILTGLFFPAAFCLFILLASIQFLLGKL